jgi:uncharacterized pyridoxal phosphate-containing UPF0001 family protein
LAKIGRTSWPEKRPHIEATLGPNSGIVWHFIGTLQSRQTNPVADHADVFHALDRLKIAHRLSNRLVENGRAPRSPVTHFSRSQHFRRDE